MLKRKTPLKAKTGFKKKEWGDSPTGTTKPLQKPLKRKKLRPRSVKRSKEEGEYYRIGRAFLAENSRCAVYPNMAATQVHHSRGRAGRLLTDRRWFIPTSQEGHSWIESHHREAREICWNGIPLMCRPAEFNTYPKQES